MPVDPLRCSRKRGVGTPGSAFGSVTMVSIASSTPQRLRVVHSSPVLSRIW